MNLNALTNWVEYLLKLEAHENGWLKVWWALLGPKLDIIFSEPGTRLTIFTEYWLCLINDIDIKIRQCLLWSNWSDLSPKIRCLCESSKAQIRLLMYILIWNNCYRLLEFHIMDWSKNLFAALKICLCQSALRYTGLQFNYHYRIWAGMIPLWSLSYHQVSCSTIWFNNVLGFLAFQTSPVLCLSHKAQKIVI